MRNLLQNVVSALVEGVDDGTEASFCAQASIHATDVAVHVKGIGDLAWPLAAHTMDRLLGAASKAGFGLREQTLLDDKVRDTYEIAAREMNVTIAPAALKTMLHAIRHGLGLPEDAPIVPHFYNMLIYKTGQFFDKHQDSEKVPNMIATLVLVLPSAHIGGDLVIEHGQESCRFVSEHINTEQVKWIAFYPDCTHHVEKVKQGHRVMLTYQLALESVPSFSVEKPNPALITSIKQYFSSDITDDLEPLVYLLDHSYSEHSLRWGLLKGADRTNARAFYHAAQQTGCHVYLALAEIQQTWTTDGNDDHPEIEECIEDETSLSYWVDSREQEVAFGAYHVAHGMVCWKKATEDLKPFSSEYEGYVGNYGNTMDYWYRRAAVVLWPGSHHFKMCLKLKSEKAHTELMAYLASPGNEPIVIHIINQANRELYGYYDRMDNHPMLLRIAHYVKDADCARMLLLRLDWQAIRLPIADHLALLQTRYGRVWCVELLTQWRAQRGSIEPLQKLDVFCATFLEHGGDAEVMQVLLRMQMDILLHSDQAASRPSIKRGSITRDLPKRMQLLQALLFAGARIHDVTIAQTMTTHCISLPMLYPETALSDLWLTLKKKLSTEYLVQYEPLRQHLMTSIQQRISSGMRATDDWSIKVALPCSCEHCKVAQQFLDAQTEIKKIWPIVQATREHVMASFNDMNLPVDLSVERKGSPHKLVIEKNPSLHTEDRKTFETLQHYHQRLATI